MLNCSIDDGRKYWKCAKRWCSAWFVLQTNSLLQQSGDHNHPINNTEGVAEKLKINTRV